MTIKHQFKNFETLIAGSDLPLLVVFYTIWCGPSVLMNSILERVNERMKKQLKIIKIDSENYPELASRYQIHVLPTLLLFKNGQPIARIESESNENLISAERLIEQLQALI